jgi:TolB-like protein/tetratricopeptide (TPR) repeat protein
VRFLFADYILDTDRRELCCSGALVPVEPQVFDLLTYLVQNRERVVSKDDLFASVWSGRIVADSTLASRIAAARKAVGDSGEEQKLIRTVARKGIRFIGTVGCKSNGAKPVDAAGPRRDDLQEPIRPPLPPFERPAIAVLPFVNMSGDPEQEYFSDGISEDLITALSRLRWFFVIARNSSFTYKRKSVHMKQVAEELGVGYVIEGSVRKDGNRVRITAQLNDVATGSHVWAERYDRKLTDVFAVQDEITTAIVAAIEPNIYAAENYRARRKAPDSLDAWDLVMRSLSHYWKVTRQDQLIAQGLLRKAIALDPNYGQALSVLATSHMRGVHLGWEDLATAVPQAEEAAFRAVDVAGDDSWARTALGSVYFATRRLDEAIKEFETALQLNPNFCMAHGYYALALCYCGRTRDAYEMTQHAVRHSPRDPSLAIYHGVAAYARLIEKKYAEAIALARDAIRQRGDLSGAYRVLTVAAGMSGDLALAATALQELRRIQPSISLDWIANQLPWKSDGDREHYLEGFRRAGLD